MKNLKFIFLVITILFLSEGESNQVNRSPVLGDSLNKTITLNDEKRNINVLKQEFLGIFIKDFEKIMKYDKSSQYVNRKLKRTENPRIK